MQTVGEAIERNAAYYAASEAFVQEGRRVTHGEYAERARKLGSALYRLGLRSQDRVAVLAMNCLEYYEIYGAGEISGYITAPVNVRLAPPEIADMLVDAAPKVFFFEEQYERVVGNLRSASALSGIEHYVCIGSPDAGWAVAYEDLVSSGAVEGAPLKASPDDYAYLYYTSGTTGRPKGVVHTHRSICVSATRSALVTEFNGATRLLQTTPAFHTGGKGYVGSTTWVGGASIIQRGFDARKVLQAIETERVTFTFMVAAMIQAIVDVPEVSSFDLSSLSKVVSAAAPIPVPLLRQAIQLFGPIFAVQYGSTEAGSIANLPSHHVFTEGAPERVSRLASVGFPCPDVAMRIVGPDGQDCPPNTPGEVWVKSPANFAAYWNNSVQTIEAFRDGWYLTGDIGYLDDECFLFLVDRRKDMIISGGENIYSREVENAVNEHPAIVESAVIGVPDPLWGEAVMAVVIIQPGGKLTEAGLIDHCRDRIARYKCPKFVSFVSELPRVAGGKIDKVALRQMYRGQTS